MNTRTSEVEFQHNFSTHSMLNLQGASTLIYSSKVDPKRSQIKKKQIQIQNPRSRRANRMTSCGLHTFHACVPQLTCAPMMWTLLACMDAPCF